MAIEDYPYSFNPQLVLRGDSGDLAASASVTLREAPDGPALPVADMLGNAIGTSLNTTARGVLPAHRTTHPRPYVDGGDSILLQQFANELMFNQVDATDPVVATLLGSNSATNTAAKALIGDSETLDPPVANLLGSSSSQVRAAALLASPDLVEAATGWAVARNPNGPIGHAHVQAAATRALTEGKRLYAAGEYTSSQTLTVSSDADLSGLTINYTGTGVAVRVGSAVARRDRINVSTPRVIHTGKTGSGWASVAGTVGVELVNLQSCTILVTHVRNCAIGLLERASGGSIGNVHNTITIGHLENNEINLDIAATGTNWTNQNVHVGGRFSHESGEGVNVAGTRHIRIGTHTAHPINNHLFLNPSLEGRVAEFHAEIGGYNNVILNGRWEVSGGGTPRVLWATGAVRNQILFGHSSDLIAETGTAAGARNHIFAPNGARFSQTHLENPGGVDLPVETVTTTGAAGYAVQRTSRSTRMKRPEDPFDRLRFDHQNGRVYFGLGSAEATAFLGIAGSALRIDGFQTRSSAAAGSASALPGPPAGYQVAFIDGALRAFPYYNL